MSYLAKKMYPIMGNFDSIVSFIIYCFIIFSLLKLFEECWLWLYFLDRHFWLLNVSPGCRDGNDTLWQVDVDLMDVLFTSFVEYLQLENAYNIFILNLKRDPKRARYGYRYVNFLANPYCKFVCLICFFSELYY